MESIAALESECSFLRVESQEKSNSHACHKLNHLAVRPACLWGMFPKGLLLHLEDIPYWSPNIKAYKVIESISFQVKLCLSVFSFFFSSFLSGETDSLKSLQ